LEKLLKNEAITEEEKNLIAAKKMQKIVKKMIEEKGDIIAKSYVDKV
jgi:hypothetical protein